MLVTALVAISSMLQRERTALRVMLQLLVNQRETLQLGDLVPIGDLFDVIAEGDEPFTEEMRIHFAQARRLYVQKLLPLLETQHKLTRDEVRSRPHDDPAAFAFRGDDRLLKTLLLAALTPEVEAFQGMTASRLAALNHGSIRSPIPGAETKAVLSRCRGWARHVGEIRIGEDPGNANPTISLQLSGVDTEGILEKVRSNDNDGNRKRVLRQLLAAELGLAPEEDSGLIPVHPFLWRGTQRQVEVGFANLRETPRDLLRGRLGGGDWKLIVDLPLDVDKRSAKDDLARLNEFRADEPDTATLCWVPAFFTHESLRDLGDYVVLDHLLNGERFNEAASHLSQVDRAAARALLDNQRSQLKQRMISCLEAAYGVSGHAAGLVDPSFDLADRFQSLDRRFEPRPPAAANLREALANLLDQIQSYRFPRHPKFETKVQTKDLRRVLDVALRAAHEPQGRVEVEKERDLRTLMRQIANPLGLGEMHEAVFLLSDRWRNELTRAAAAIGGKVTVGRLRDALEQPEPLGLPRDVKDLLILVFAEQTNRSFFLSGGPVAAELGGLQEDFELREQTLPDAGTWNAARERTWDLFGWTPPSILSASNVSPLREALQTQAAGLRGPLSELVGELRQWLDVFAAGPAAGGGETPARLRTAEALLTVVESLAAARPEEVLERFAAATLATSGAAMGNAAKKAGEVVAALRNAQVSVLTSLQQVGPEWQGKAGEILDRLREALTHDELAVPLAPAVSRAVKDAATLLSRTTRPADAATTAPATTASAPGNLGTRREWRIVERDEREGLDAERAAALFREIEDRLRAEAGRRLRIEWTVEARTADGTDGE